MEPLLSTLPARSVPNEPHNLLARLYREIGISAVAAALQLSDSQLAVSHGDSNGADAAPEARSDATAIPAPPAEKAA